MKDIFRITICFLLIVFSGCSKEIKRERSNDIMTPLADCSVDYPLVMDSIMIKEFSLSLPEKYSKNPKLKSHQKSVKGIFPLKGTKWGTESRRNGDVNPNTKTLLDYIYIVNYNDDLGFAIISSYDYNGRVLGYSDYGNLSDTISNPGLQFYLADLAKYSDNIPIIPKRDMIIESGDTTYFYSFDHMFTVEEVLEEYGVEPYFEWDQNAPYNEDVLDYFGVSVPVGCVALAMGQALAYQRFPDSTYSHVLNSTLYFDWDDIQDTYGPLEHCYEVSAYLTELGFSIGTVYSSLESLATISGVLGSVDSLGLTYDYVVGFNVNDIEGSLMRCYPVIVFGQTSGGAGHAWLAESIKSSRIYVYYVYNVVDNFQINHGQQVFLDRVEGPLHKLYYNWGCGGYGNGYFESNSFGYTSTFYNHNVSILSGLRPVFNYPIN